MIRLVFRCGFGDKVDGASKLFITLMSVLLIILSTASLTARADDDLCSRTGAGLPILRCRRGRGFASQTAGSSRASCPQSID